MPRATNKEVGEENLLVLDGDRYFIDGRGDLEAIFKVTRVDKSTERPHGLKYALMLLNTRGERVICFDNAHAVYLGTGPGKKRSNHYDHKHIGNKVTPYKFTDAYTLIEDFWVEVDRVVK